MAIPPLTEALVVEQAREVIDEAMGEVSRRWRPSRLEVLATATDGPYGLAIVDAHGDRTELQMQTWRFTAGRWSIRACQLVEGPGPDTETPWAGGSTGLFSEDMIGSYRAYGLAPGCRAVEITFTGGERHRVPVLDNGVWAFVTAEQGHADQATVNPRR